MNKKMTHKIIDAHAHCGIQDRSQAFEDYFSSVRGSGITGVAMFAPVAEIYDRYDFHFKDTPEWRKKRQAANEYLLTLGNQELEVFPYFFHLERLCSGTAHASALWHQMAPAL